MLLFFFFSFTFDINFPKSNNNCSNLGKNIFKYFTLIHRQSDFICTESILFRLYGFEPSVFTIYFISFFVPAQNQLFSLPLFFFAHLILVMLGLFYLFFTFCNFGGVFGAQFNVWGGFFAKNS